jgi:Ribbon-helix-helix protein, copG family.
MSERRVSVTITLDPETLEFVDRMAEAAGLTRSAYVTFALRISASVFKSLDADKFKFDEILKQLREFKESENL